MIALAINLAIILGTRLTLSNFIELFTPYINALMKSRSESEGADGRVPSKAEMQFSLDKYDKIQGSLDDYAELAVQFGYVTFFIAALPIATLGAFFNNYIEIRTDAYKLLRGVQRPVPSGAEDIGTWMSIFSLMASICVVTNAGLICFTMNILDDFSMKWRLWVFLGFQWFCFVCQYLIQLVVPDEPLEVIVQLERTKFITDKLIRKVPDDDNADEEEFYQVNLDPKALKGNRRASFVANIMDECLE